LNFIAQIDLSELKYYETNLPLPKSGMLYFFFDAVVQPWGFHRDEKCGSKVLYALDRFNLRRTDPPEQGLVLHGCPLDLRQSKDLPCQKDLTMDASASDKTELLELGSPTTDFQHTIVGRWDYNLLKVAGWPAQIQDLVRWECEAVSRGFNLWKSNSPAFQGMELRAEISESSRNWKLLL